MKEKKRKRRAPAPRQEWQPHWTVRLLRTAWMVVFTAAKVALGAVCTVGCILVICGLIFAAVLGDYLQQDVIPNASVNIDEYFQELTSSLYYQDGDGNWKELRKVYTDVDRQYAYYDEIPQDLIHAAIAIEDKRFYEHEGVDWFTTMKACVNIFFGGGDIAGGSTITQQLVKNITQNDAVTVQRKVTEIFSAQVVEQQYDKDFIIERYLNEIFLGEGCYGVKSAAAAYFGKELSDLTAAECASIISITNNPSLFNPYGETFEYDGKVQTAVERNRGRQLLVLEQMNLQGFLTDEEYEQAVNQELVFKSGIDEDAKNFRCANPDCGYVGKKATYVVEEDHYFCPVCGTETNVSLDNTEYVYSWFEDLVLEDVAKALAEKRGMEWNDTTFKSCMEIIQRGGFHIYTTLDMDVQKQVDLIYKNLEEIPEARSKQQLQSAIVVIDNKTGDIAGISGGVGEKTDFFAFNRANTELQTGSSIKPITVYGPAFETGVFSPISIVKDLPMNYDNGAWPLNYDRRFSYTRTIRQGVNSSINAVAANLLDAIGTDYGFDFAKNRFGLHSLLDEVELSDGSVLTDRSVAALALGAQNYGVSVREMANAYAVFANHGVYRTARTFLRVYDSNGNVVLDNVQEQHDVLSEKALNYMNYCLVTTVRYDDTPADMPRMEEGGKTGTTSNNRDRWFCGFTGYYTAAVWCGYDTPEQISLVGNYSNPSARLWRKVLGPLHEGLESIDLYDSSHFRYPTICLDSGKKATEACALDVRGIDRTFTGAAYYEDVPTDTCDVHVLVDYCVTGGGVATEYCTKFPDVKIEKRALVKITEETFEELLKAKDYKLDKEYLMDAYVYLVNSKGKDVPFHGFDGKANADVEAPYIVCPVHTKKAWEQYQAEHSTQPTLPTFPFFPGFPSVG